MSSLTDFFQIFKGKNIAKFYIYCSREWKRGNTFQIIVETSINITKKQHYRLISLMNINVKVPSKILPSDL